MGHLIQVRCTKYISLMDFALPLYAVQRLADGTWLVRTLMGDPTLPAVDVVAVIGERAYSRRQLLANAAIAASRVAA
jgi:hypothetical protein